MFELVVVVATKGVDAAFGLEDLTSALEEEADDSEVTVCWDGVGVALDSAGLVLDEGVAVAVPVAVGFALTSANIVINKANKAGHSDLIAYQQT